MEVPLNQEVTLNVDGAKPGVIYKWIVKKGSDIINTQSNTIFTYTFDQSGEYFVNLTATDDNNVVRNTSILVLAGEKFKTLAEQTEKAISPLAFSVTTLPHLTSEGRVMLVGESGAVLFRVESASPDILEYRIDLNIFEDSDGNGVANDDIDNSADESYLRGGTWETTYSATESNKAVAEVTLVTREGKKAKKQVEIIFNNTLSSTSGAPVAVLDTTPTFRSDDQIVHLYGEQDKIAFYSRNSTGKILEYRIDKNIFVDTDQDGNPANDVDNINTPSFKTGDIWETVYHKTDGQIIAQLIVVGEGGQGSRIQRAIRFDDQTLSAPSSDSQKGIQLVADKSFVLKGDPIRFTVSGLALSLDQYIFRWDFDGDDVMDKEVEGSNTIETIYENPGTFNVTVEIRDKDGNTGERSLEVLSKDSIKTTADFEFKIEGNAVTFTDISLTSLNLSNKQLQYQWNFGDTDEAGFEKQKDQIGIANPVYIYNKAGTYLVTLTVTDSDQVTDIKTAEVVVAQDLSVAQPDQNGDTAPEKPVKEPGKSSFIVKLLKIVLYLVLIIVTLVFLILGGFLIFFKLQNPELTFDELIDELKIKILTAMGVHEMIEPSHPEPTITPPTPRGSVSTPSVSDDEDSDEESPDKAEENESKDTFAGRDVIEGEVEEGDDDSEALDEDDVDYSEEETTSTEIPPRVEPEENSSSSTAPAPENPVAPSSVTENPSTPDANVHPEQTGNAPLNKTDGPVPEWLKGTQ